jgi:hypothetical protein
MAGLSFTERDDDHNTAGRSFFVFIQWSRFEMKSILARQKHVYEFDNFSTGI